MKYSEPLSLRTTFSGPIFFDKMLEANILYEIYLLTFYLFDEIEKISKSLMQIILQRQRQFWQICSCNLNVYIFYLRFALGSIHGDRCDRKHQKQLFYKSKTPFLVVEVGNTVTFWRYARFDVILTSVTIIKQVCFANCFVMSHLLT